MGPRQLVFLRTLSTKTKLYDGGILIFWKSENLKTYVNPNKSENLLENYGMSLNNVDFSWVQKNWFLPAFSKKNDSYDGGILINL